MPLNTPQVSPQPIILMGIGIFKLAKVRTITGEQSQMENTDQPIKNIINIKDIYLKELKRFSSFTYCISKIDMTQICSLKVSTLQVGIVQLCTLKYRGIDFNQLSKNRKTIFHTAIVMISLKKLNLNKQDSYHCVWGIFPTYHHSKEIVYKTITHDIMSQGRSLNVVPRLIIYV